MSTQEKLVEALSQGIIGKSYVFLPDKHTKRGVGVREPADLVWACNNCIVLIYMTAKQKIAEDDEQRKEDREKLIGHNLKQAKGGLKEWRGGKPLLGSGGGNTHEIYYDNYEYKIVLSLVDYADDEFTYHWQEAKKLTVDACLTFSSKTLLMLSDFGGVFLDFLNFISLLAELSRKSSERFQASDVLVKYKNDCIYSSGIKTIGLMVNENEILKISEYYFNIIKDNLVSNRRNDEVQGVVAIFNDMQLTDKLILLNVIVAGIERAGESHRISRGASFVSAGLYHIFILTTIVWSGSLVGKSFNPEKSAEFTIKAADSAHDDVNARGNLSFVWDTVLNSPAFIGGFRKEVPTFCEEKAQILRLSVSKY